MNYKLSKLAVGLAVVCACAGQANAATYVVNQAALTSAIGYSFSALVNGAFSDGYTFSIAQGSTLSSSATPLNLSGTITLGPYTFPFNTVTSALTVALYNTAGNTLVPPTGPGSYLVGAGNYSLDISGTGSGTFGAGAYAGNLKAVTAPVPEPQTWAMMLGGLGLIGFMSYRRRQYS
jgi:hypothetical protein